MLLKGKTAVVTGGSRGIGAAIAVSFAENGADVAVVYAGTDERAAETVAKAKAFGVRAAAYKCDVADFALVEETFRRIGEDFGRIDILVNNAGVTRDKLLLQMTEEDFDRVLAVNLKGAFNTCKAVCRQMARAKSGRIINISSVSGLMGNPGQANYAASKAGLIGLTKTLAKEYASRGVTCNAVAPGFIETEMTAAMPAPALEAAAGRHPRQAAGQARGHCRGGAVSGLRRGLLHHRRGAQGRRRPVYLKTETHMRRVVVTGLGAITPVGKDINSFWDSLTAGKHGIAPITRFDTTDYKAKLAAEVKDFSPADYYTDKSEMRRTDLFAQYAMGAAVQAMADSGIEGKIDGTRLGVYVGSGIGGMSTFVSETLKLESRGPGRVSPFFIPMMISNMAAGTIAIRFGAKGPTLPVVTACATSSNTVGEAYRAVAHGYADAILAGGSEATVCPLAIAGFTNSMALCESSDPDRASIPFDAERCGFVMGEGAGMLLLEEYEHALGAGRQNLRRARRLRQHLRRVSHHRPAPRGGGRGPRVRARD